MKKTFIKMQSLSRKAWLCGGLIAMAAALVGCSSDAPDPGDPNSGVAQTDGDPLTVISDQATLSGLVLNYENNNSSEAPKAFTLPEVPKHDNAVSVSSPGFKDGFYNGGVVSYVDRGIVIPADSEYKGDLYINTKINEPINIFIEGKFEGNFTGSGYGVNVYILPGGQWILGSQDLDFGQYANIFDYDDGLVFSKKEMSRDKNGVKGGNIISCSYYGNTFPHSNNDFHLTNYAKLFVKGAIEVDDLVLDVNTLLSSNCLTAEDVYITNTAVNYVGSYINAKNIEMDSGAKICLNNGAYVKVEEKLSTLNHSSGFSSPNGKSVIRTNVYYTAGSPESSRPNNTNINDINVAGNFSGNIDIFVDVIKKSSGEIKKDQLQTGSEDVNFYSIESFKEEYGMTECPSGEGDGNGGNGGGDKPDPVKPDPNKPDPFPNNPEIFVEVIGGDHTHPISATGVDVSGNKAYISWHERGGNIHGCIETIEINKTDKGGYEAKVTSWMETEAWEYNSGDPLGATASTAYDFNHIIYDQIANSLLTVGEHAKKGGIIGRINLGKITLGGNEQLNVFENRQLGVEKWSGKENQGLVAGGSGNCVVISPDRTKLLVASRGGYLAIPYDSDPFVREDGKHIVTSKDIKSLVTDGSAKHLALYGDQLVSIEYIESSENADWWEDTKTALPAKISLWNWKDFPEGTPTSVEVPAFSPVFGKDVIAMDANYIYSCQGHNGVVIYNKSLQKVASFNVKDCYARNLGQCRNSLSKPESESAAANGLAVDDQYLYIAYGAAGLWVLDKNDNFKPVGFYNSAVSMYPQNDEEHPKASANYVKVMNTDDNIKKIIVAYGRDGVKVFKMPLGK